MLRICSLLIAFGMLAACSSGGADEEVKVAIIGETEGLAVEGVRLSFGAQHYRLATREGLVTLDSTGQVVPALAERWIVTPDGLSYIFRLRDSSWRDGQPITAENIRRMILDNLDLLEGTSLGLDFDKVSEVRAMTGRVIEIRLSSPMPEFLRLLAQPELGFSHDGSGSGPMIASALEDAPSIMLTAVPPEERGLPALEDWEEIARPVTLRTVSAQEGVRAFANTDIDLLLGGRISDFPIAQTGFLANANIRIDPALGIFGLVVQSDDGMLSSAPLREALSMSLNRASLLAPLGLTGWQASSWVIPPAIFDEGVFSANRWPQLSLDERRRIARQRVSSWRSQAGLPAGQAVSVSVYLPPGPGSERVFEQLRTNWQTIGVMVARAQSAESAQLVLRDRLARYSSPRWYLNQFHCSLDIGLCSPDADALTAQSLTETDMAQKAQLLAEAHSALVREEVFIPFGPPVRWSLARSSLAAFEPNPWGLHPLFPLSQPTI